MESDRGLLLLCVRHSDGEFDGLVDTDYCMVYAKERQTTLKDALFF